MIGLIVYPQARRLLLLMLCSTRARVFVLSVLLWCIQRSKKRLYRSIAQQLISCEASQYSYAIWPNMRSKWEKKVVGQKWRRMDKCKDQHLLSEVNRVSAIGEWTTMERKSTIAKKRERERKEIKCCFLAYKVTIDHERKNGFRTDNKTKFSIWSRNWQNNYKNNSKNIFTAHNKIKNQSLSIKPNPNKVNNGAIMWLRCIRLGSVLRYTDDDCCWYFFAYVNILFLSLSLSSVFSFFENDAKNLNCNEKIKFSWIHCGCVKVPLVRSRLRK